MDLVLNAGFFGLRPDSIMSVLPREAVNHHPQGRHDGCRPQRLRRLQQNGGKCGGRPQEQVQDPPHRQQSTDRKQERGQRFDQRVQVSPARG